MMLSLMPTNLGKSRSSSSSSSSPFEVERLCSIWEMVEISWGEWGSCEVGLERKESMNDLRAVGSAALWVSINDWALIKGFGVVWVSVVQLYSKQFYLKLVTLCNIYIFFEF